MHDLCASDSGSDSKTCGAGVQHRHRKIKVEPKYGAPPCPKRMRMKRVCNRYDCVGKGPSHLCGYTTPPGGETAWKLYGTSGLYLDVDTRACSFTVCTCALGK